MKKISVVMIVKNEEAVLARCLDSVKEADEIIICDTGSTDKTIEIAKKYTDKVYTDFTWCDDFAAARNHAKSKATGDWILSIDADEFLHDWSEVRNAVEQSDYAVRVLMQGENAKLNFYFARLFKNTPDIFWREPIHNVLSIDGDGDRVGNVAITFGWSPAHEADPDRALRCLLKAVETDPTPRRLYYLGREYWYKGQLKEAIETLVKYVQVAHYEAEKADAFLIMSMAYSRLGEDDAARSACAQAILINPEFKEAIIWMGHIMPPEKAQRWYNWGETASNKEVFIVRT